MPTTFDQLVRTILDVINALIISVFALLFLYLVWKTIDAWIINAGDPAKREEGRRTALLAVLMTVLMICTWGIVAMLKALL